jgi:hypothetical protein
MLWGTLISENPHYLLISDFPVLKFGFADNMERIKSKTCSCFTTPDYWKAWSFSTSQDETLEELVNLVLLKLK